MLIIYIYSMIMFNNYTNIRIVGYQDEEEIMYSLSATKQKEIEKQRLEEDN